MRLHETTSAANESMPTRRRPAALQGLQSQAGNRAVASLLQPRAVQRAPDEPQSIGDLVGSVLGPSGIGGSPAPEPHAQSIGDLVGSVLGPSGLGGSPGPAAGNGGVGGIGGAMGGIGTSIKQIMDEQTLQATETGLLGAGQDIFHGMESFAKELPGVGDLLGGSAAAPKHAAARHGKAPAHQAAAEHHAATHGSKGAARAPAGQQHASKGHAQHGAAHAHAGGAKGAAAKPGGPGVLESMHQKAQLMEFEAGALDTAATVGQGISDFAHEIPFVSELL
jgi:hypothetical protein